MTCSGLLSKSRKLDYVFGFLCFTLFLGGKNNNKPECRQSKLIKFFLPLIPVGFHRPDFPHSDCIGF